MRILFMGTPDFAVPTLAAIAAQRHELVACYTRAPAQAGRGMAEKPSPVHRLADKLGLPVRYPRSLRSEIETQVFAAFTADVAVVVAYGLILPPAILALPRFGCLNLHGSLLPRWRGAAPIQRAVMAGDRVSGVGVMRMEAGLDTGPVALEARVDIGPEMTAGDLHDALAPLGADLMLRALGALERGRLVFTPQDETGVTYAQKIDKAECRIDWRRPAGAVLDHIRGLSPVPGAFVEADLGRGPERIKILRARPAAGKGAPGTLLDDALSIACGDGALQLTQVQRAGKAPLDGLAFLRGTRLGAGQPFGLV
jgi:methionyl-tRNA formyltransferase